MISQRVITLQHCNITIYINYRPERIVYALYLPRNKLIYVTKGKAERLAIV